MPKRQSVTKVVEKDKTRINPPRNYKVIMHNDDVTTMEFVVNVLKTVFFKPEDVATELMLQVHTQGKAVVGIYPFDIAKSKVQKATDMAKNNNFPLKITYCPE